MAKRKWAYVLRRNGEVYKTFVVANEFVLAYFCACQDIAPDDHWDIAIEEVS